MRPGEKYQEAFFELNPDSRSFIKLFDYVPGACFYAKDVNHRYVAANQLVLDLVFGLPEEELLLGRSDMDFQPPAFARAFHDEDRRVMEGKVSIPNQVWLVPHVSGTPKWYLSTKTPIFSQGAGEVMGVAGVMYPIETPAQQASFFGAIWPAIQFLENHWNEPVSMANLARLTQLSTTQFNLQFRKILHLSPTEFLLKRRIQGAQQMLSSTQLAVGEIALDSGFYDQSHFTKRFRRVTGMTPTAYRNQFGR